MKLFYVLERTGKDPLSIDIDENDTVEKLGKRIKEEQESRYYAHYLRLYFAKDEDDGWLKAVDSEALTRKEIQRKRVGMCRSHFREMYDDNQLKVYFGENFVPNEEDVHVIVIFPEAPSKLMNRYVFAINQPVKTKKRFKSYFKIAEILKNAEEVVMLDENIKRVQGMKGAPFILLENSSGMGKTQMAFNLMARDDLDVFYINTNGKDEFDLLGPYKKNSLAFQRCVEEDLLSVHETTVEGIARNSELYTYGFICALLTGAKKFCGKKRKEDVEEILASRQKRCVFFLDEFPLLSEEERAYSLFRKEDVEKVNYLRFMRNVFRVFGLAVIISSRTSSAIKIGAADARLQSDDESSLLWCVVVPSFPRFQDPSIDRIPEVLKSIVSNSRPLFANLAIRYILENPVDEKDIVKYLDEMARRLLTDFLYEKNYSYGCLIGQACLFLCTKHTDYVDDGEGILINRHYACLRETEPFDLNINKANKIVKNDMAWKSGCMFPPIKEDILLYLVLMGERALRDSRGNSSPFYCDLHFMERHWIQAHDADNTSRPLNEEMHLEALVSGSIVLASHKGGFFGIGFDAFLSALLYQLDMRTSRNEYITFPFLVSGLRIPFLAPPNVEWPDFLLPIKLNLGNLKRTKNNKRIDLLILDNSLSVECRDRKDKLQFEDMKAIVRRIPKQTIVHLVTVDSLQDSYFTEEDTFDGLVEHEQLIWLQHAFFYRIGRNTELEQIDGIENKCRKPNCHMCRMEKLVIFMELGDRRRLREG